MPPPSLSSSTIDELAGPGGAAASRPPMSWASATSPISSTTGPCAAAAHAERGRDRAVDPVRAAVGEHARRRLAGREERLDVAHRHRGGDDERRLGRQRATPSSAATRGSLSSAGASAAAIALRGRAVGARASRRATRARGRRGAVRERVERRRGSAATIVATAPAGSCHAASGSNATCSASSSAVQPLAQRLGGRQVADAQHEVGRVRGGPVGVAQQRVVVGDRGRAAARAGQRVGEQRHRRPARRSAASAAPSRGSRSARPATITARGRVVRARARSAVDQRRRRRPARAAGA